MKFIAHIKENDNAIQSVEEHSRAVSDLAKKYCQKLNVQNIAQLQGLLHDMGKLSETFNNYILGKNNKRRGEIDHSYVGAKYICELADKLDKSKYYHVSRFIARTIISHHGLHDWIDEEGGDYFIERISKTIDYDEIEVNIKCIFNKSEIIDLLKKANEEYMAVRAKLKGISDSIKTFTFYLGLFERFMQSVLIDADYTDTSSFMSGFLTEKEYDTQDLWKQMRKKLTRKLDTFKNKKDKISIQRKSISERCENFAEHEVRTCKLIVPTGGGKTLSSLRFAISYCEKFDMDRIIYVAPFMSILEQNSQVIQEIVGEDSFLEHHSNILQEIDEYEELKEYELHSEKWDKPVIATTMVQFLNALFKGKSSSVRRMHRLSKSVIIIDEIQSLPLKCVNMFNLAVNFLTHICGSVVVLCSATQPVLNATAYPVILDKNSSMTGDYSEDFRIFQRTEIVPQLSDSGYSYQSAAEFCSEKYLENKNLLIVVNTKKSASEIYQRIKSINNVDDDDKAIVKHLSTNMCPQHRKMVIDDIRRLLNDHKKVICITTQLIEAGVDISFNCVVRSLAGMDNSAQAAGRCNRNGEIDGICPVYIINITDENLGTMQEIKTAQSISRLIIGSNRFDDLLDAEAMSIYFQKLYAEEKSELSYNVKDGGCDTNLVNLLSVNKIRYDMKQKKSVQYAAQAFKTAGDLFKVIDNNTFDVIVPFDNEAKHIIQRLQSELNHYETTELLRKAQKYTINVYEQAIRELDSIGALNIGNNGIYSLNEGYYDNEIGLNYDKSKKQVLMM